MTRKTTVKNGPIQSKEAHRGNNRCNRCKVKDVTTCPLQDHALDMFGWDGLETCAMGDTIDKMITAIKVDNRFLNPREKGKKDE